jgi:hypothetical protein
MQELTVGSTTYRLIAAQRGDQFVAHAARADNNERFGIECAGAAADEAENRLARWLEWQHEHTQALEVLQQAERLYHRAMAGAAFATSTDAAEGESRMSLESVDAARLHLDDVRGRRPNV